MSTNDLQALLPRTGRSRSTTERGSLAPSKGTRKPRASKKAEATPTPAQTPEPTPAAPTPAAAPAPAAPRPPARVQVAEATGSVTVRRGTVWAYVYGPDGVLIGEVKNAEVEAVFAALR